MPGDREARQTFFAAFCAVGWYRPESRVMVVCGVLPLSANVPDVQAKLRDMPSTSNAAELYAGVRLLGHNSPEAALHEGDRLSLKLVERCLKRV